MSKSNKYALITGCDGLIGSEAVKFFSNKNYKIIGIDNNSRKKFFGEEASVLGNRKQLKNEIKNFKILQTKMQWNIFSKNIAIQLI